MTIRKNEQWGREITAPSDLLFISDDQQLAMMNQTSIGVLTGGDIHSALGSPAPVPPGSLCTQVDIDAMYIEIQVSNTEEYSRLGSSSIEIGTFRPSLFRRHQYVCVTNGGLVHGRNLAPRAHPNDGVLDAITMTKEMTFRHRLIALKKATTGTHIPHPNIQVSRSESFSFLRTSQRENLRIDGERISRWLSVRVTVQPDYWKIVV